MLIKDTYFFLHFDPTRWDLGNVSFENMFVLPLQAHLTVHAHTHTHTKAERNCYHSLVYLPGQHWVLPACTANSINSCKLDLAWSSAGLLLPIIITSQGWRESHNVVHQCVFHSVDQRTSEGSVTTVHHQGPTLGLSLFKCLLRQKVEGGKYECIHISFEDSASCSSLLF